jgi:hypothetical protein
LGSTRNRVTFDTPRIFPHGRNRHRADLAVRFNRRLSVSEDHSPFKTLADIIQAKEPPKCGSTGTASTGYLLAKLMDEAFKAKLNTVTGYQGGSEIDIAVERGEIVCRGMDIPPHFGREPFDGWHKRGFDRHILQSGPKRDPRMGDAPTLFELMEQYKTPEVMRSVTRIVLASGDFGRPMVPDQVCRQSESKCCASLTPKLCAILG